MSLDLLGPLPEGTVVLEASAGTGKTYAIAALATRYVAEAGLPLSQLMLVTFGRAATQELRERTRQRLTSAAHGLADPPAARRSDDGLLAHLATGTDAEVAKRRRRLVVALSDFDAATITTTHSFCQRMLDGLGVAGDRELGVELVESVDELVTEVADDLYLKHYAGYGAEPLLTAAEAREVARTAVADRQALLVPADADPDSAAGQRVALACRAREEVDRRKRAAGVRDFDDLLVLLRDALADDEHGAQGCARVRERYRVVLVDEFQDTDPVQWEVLRRAFHGFTTLVLIGDPKQAIYAFRGAEVLSYLDAVRVADRREDLDTNWRSDAGLVRGLDALYGAAALGHPGIVVRPVRAAHPVSRLPGETPLRVRWLDREGSGPLGRSGYPAVAALRRRVAADLADEVVRLLQSRVEVPASGGGTRPVEPGDVAVLVRWRRQVEPVREALQRVGVPSVFAGTTSVFSTAAATDWLWLLQALEQPQRPGRVRLAALTPLLGHRAAALDESLTSQVSAFLRELSGLFDEAGFAAVVERLGARTGLDARLLAEVGGERRLTDLRHVAQVLDRAAVEQSLGLTALATWLAERIADPASGSAADRSRRLESDAAAVQVLTVHTSKGLEFPVVHVPFAWDAARNPNQTDLLLHDGDQRVRDLGGKDGPGYAGRKELSDREEAGEELRLLYVALTRAQSQVVAWWAPGAQTSASPLHRLLLGRTPGEAEPALRAPVPSDVQVGQGLRGWAATAPDVLAVEPVGEAHGTRWTPPADHPRSLGAAVVTRGVDHSWRRTSYSALTASVHEAVHVPGVGSEPELTATTDEPAEPLADAPAPADAPAAGVASPMDALPAGAAFGTLVHEVLEVTDTAAADLAAELLARCREAVARRMAEVDPAVLAAALLPVLHTPLGAGGPTLAQLPPSDRLAELDFELPLAGGDTPAAPTVTLQRTAALLRRHLPADDPLAGYPDLLAAVEAPPLRGFLSGSIDAVLRLPGPRYVVVDYKTNRIARGPLTAASFSREAMAAEMLHAHYPLQALLYAVALHRYLRWRQPGYDPAQHLGGVAYLFVRGMVGPDTPAGCGVFDWQPPPALVVELSDLLAGR